MTEEKRAILRRVPAFAGLSDDDCDAVLAVLKARRGNAGDVLFREGDRGESLVIVLEGELVCTVKTASGEKEIARLRPGEVVGEMALFDAEPRSASVSCPQSALVVELSRTALAQLRVAAPRACAQVYRNLLADVARRLRDAGEQLTDFALGPQSGRDAPPPSSRHLTATQLRAFSIMSDRDPEDLELLAHVATLKQFPAGSPLVREGTAGDACYFILTGTVSVSRGGTQLATLGPAALVGQLALLDRAARSATVTSIDDVSALEIRASAFANLVRSDAAIALRFQEQVALAGVRQLRAATRKLAQTTSSMPPPNSLRTLDVDDWDAPESNTTLELAIDPRAR